VRLEQETVAGRFSTLDEDGRLWLDLADGSRRSFTAGDVFFPGL
jgi:biotin-(acetyl-CoA carboxylase) ligase